MNLIKEVFVIEDKKRIALFAPYQGIIIEIDENEKKQIAEFIDRPQFSFRDLINIFPEIEESRLLPKKVDRQSAAEETFCPDFVTLFTTLDCNLRCIYCYANAGTQKVSMSRQIVEAAIDFIVGNAKLKGQDKCFLDFHGGGEPTLNWPIFKFAVDYFQEKARAGNLTPEVSLVTNGMLSKNQIDWISERIQTVQISLDGMEEIQNIQRPTGGNRTSFRAVFQTAKSFLAKGLQVTIHCVVTEMGVSKIAEIVRFFAVNFAGATIHMEPACQCGRALTTDQQFPSAELFVRGFIEAQEIAKSFGVEVFYSGASPRLVRFYENFCGISEPSFIVTPNGLVTACHEVFEADHPLANYFIYGYQDKLSGNFVFDYEKIRNLKRNIANIDSLCGKCFARFYCMGDCLTRSLNSKGTKCTPLLINPRCKINRELTKHYIFHQLFKKEDCYGNTNSRCERPTE